MVPRRDVFALRFILSTVYFFKNVTYNNLQKPSEFPWARDVLNKYFKLVDTEHKEYLEALSVFKSLNTKEFVNSNKKTIFINQKSDTTSFDEFSYLNKYRKSVRWFKEQIVPKEIIDKALEIAYLIPGSCNSLSCSYLSSDENFKLTRQIVNISARIVGWPNNIAGIAMLVHKQSSFSDIANRH
jgi:hypothetical protein